MQAIVNLKIKGDSLSYGDRQAPFEKVVYRGALVADTLAAAGGVLTLQNNTGYDVYVASIVLDVTTKSTGIATMSAGTAATVVLASNLVSAADVSTAAVIATAAGKVARWTNGGYLTVSGSATLAGLVGTYTITGAAA